MKYFIATYGCQMNIYDSEVISSLMISAGHEKADNISEADIIFINGCSVREHAYVRATGFAETIKSRMKTGARLYITGCLAVSMKHIPKHVSGLISPVHYNELGQLLQSDAFTDLRDLTANGDYTHVNVNNRITLYVSIIKGCNNFCSYCIVPYLRGKEISFKPESILRQIEGSINELTGEIILLGQNVNSYHYDEMNFPKLLAFIAEHFRDKRIRFLTSHPKDLSDELINTMAEHSNIMNAVHLPVQSGSDRILSIMNRGYTRDSYMGIIDKLRSAMPDITITTDIMTGFPHENDDDFNETMKLVEQVHFDDAFMYRYSSRPFTLSSYMDEPEEDVKLSRLKHLIKVQNSIKMRKMQQLIGQELSVLIERKSKKSDNDMIGRDEGDRMIVIRNNCSIGSTVKAVIQEIAGNTPIGILKEEQCI